MKTKHGIFFGFAVTLAAAIFTLAGCPTDGGGGGGSSVSEATYTGKAGGDTYKLTITAAGRAAYTPEEGDSYVLIIGSKKSTGKVSSVKGTTFTLNPGKGGSFTATVSGKNLTAMSGTIILDDNTHATLPSALQSSNDGGNSDDNGGDVPTTNGKLTVTNIPSEYNGSYIVVNGIIELGTKGIICVGSIDYLNFQEKRMDYHAAEITNGRAILNVYMWSGSESSPNILGYSGNDTVEMIAVFHNSSNVITTGSRDGNEGDGGWGDRTWIAESEPVTVKFSNGNGTFVFNEMSETRDWPNLF